MGGTSNESVELNEINTYNQNNHDDENKTQKNFKIKLFKGILNDLKDRLPYYLSDWKDSWNYRVIPSTILTFFTNIFPAIAFAQDMFDNTNNSYGVNEVLLSSAIGGIIFGIFGGQPLTIVGVTGPITIFNYTVYQIMKPHNVPFFPFMFWISIWGMISHFIISITNCVNALKFVTKFPCDIFGLFINIVYLQKGVQILTRQFKSQDFGSSGFASCTISIIMGICGVLGNCFNETKFFNQIIRQFIVDYSTPLLMIFTTGFIHFGGYLNDVIFEKLPITKSFHPTSRKNWIDVSNISIKFIFLALPFGIILSILFYFDHSISSLMAQDLKFKLRKPATFHYDLFLLGIITGISGVLGIPCPNGLIPQAPLHTESLIIKNNQNIIIGTVEQRFTNTMQGLMLLGMMTRPFLICLGLIPQCVLAGLFFIMGLKGLYNNEIINRLKFLCLQNDDFVKKSSSLSNIKRKKLILFLSFSLIGFGAEFGIVNTKGAIGFPLVLLLSVIGPMWFKKIFTQEELKILDGPVANEHTLKNL